MIIFVFNGNWQLGDSLAAAKTDSAIKAGESTVKKAAESVAKNIKSAGVEAIKDAAKSMTGTAAEGIKETVKKAKADCKMFLSSFVDKIFLPKEPGFHKIYQPRDIFLSNVQQMYDDYDDIQLCDGYAPYCKHLYVRNFVAMGMGQLKINQNNENAVVYDDNKEFADGINLPYLNRWFIVEKLPVNGIPFGNFINIILYKKDHLKKIAAANNETWVEPTYPGNKTFEEGLNYGIVDIVPVLEKTESGRPIIPIRLM